MNNLSPTTARREALIASDERRILLDIWPAEFPVAVIHIFHGLGEHPARYERFARQCNERGITVAAHNHRGHGENCPAESLGHYADSDGWEKLIDDAALAQQFLRDAYPDIPLILLGHSMGSFVAQSFLMRDNGPVDGLILSATSWSNRLQVRLGHWAAAFERFRTSGSAKSEFLNSMSFGDFNKRFAPNRTEFDWLSRDEDEVDKYIADPLSGVPSSNQLWFDLTGEILQITSATALRQIPGDLPILIVGGSKDPVGGTPGLTNIAEKYRTSGHDKVTLRIYPDGRHEMLNEINRDEYTSELIDWCLAIAANQSE